MKENAYTSQNNNSIGILHEIQELYPFSTKEIMACNVAEKPASLCSSPYLVVKKRGKKKILFGCTSFFMENRDIRGSRDKTLSILVCQSD